MDYADTIIRSEDEERARQELEDEEAAKRAFASVRTEIELPVVEEEAQEDDGGLNGDSAQDESPPAPEPVSVPAVVDKAPSFKRIVKKKKDHSALLGIKKKPSLV